MRLLKCEITIGDYTFDFVTDIEIVSTWELLTDTAQITIPKKLRYRGKDGKAKKYLIRGTEAVFKKGDAVKISIGYYPSAEFGEINPYYTAFEGYVTEVSPKRPIVIQCEDKAYNLKLMRIEKWTPETKDESVVPQDLKEVLEDLRDTSNHNTAGELFNFDIQADNILVSMWPIEKVTMADVLDKIKRTFNLQCYFRDNTLYVGLARIAQRDDDFSNIFGIPNFTNEVSFGRDIISDSALTYQNDSDITINLTCISFDETNEKIEATAGDSWGSVRTLYYYKETEDTLQKIANDMVSEFKFNGYTGSFTMFGIPQVEHGDSVKIINPDILDTEGEYVVEKVTTRFGQGGFRQEIALGERIG